MLSLGPVTIIKKYEKRKNSTLLEYHLRNKIYIQ